MSMNRNIIISKRKYFRFCQFESLLSSEKREKFPCSSGMCEGVFFLVAYEKLFRIFVCIVCFKRMLPGGFQVSVMSKHSGFAVNLLIWAQHCRGATKMGHISFAWSQESTCSHQHPSEHQSYLQHVWDKCVNLDIFPKESDSGIFSGSQCCLLYPVYSVFWKSTGFLKWCNPWGHCASESHCISRNSQRN